MPFLTAVEFTQLIKTAKELLVFLSNLLNAKDLKFNVRINICKQEKIHVRKFIL